MELINNTPHPALSFEGIDQFEQEFHVVVTRQTYTWNKYGLLVLAEEQDPLCMMDVLVDESDLMSGIIEESDLCHFKPKCDVLVKGHAYTPLSKITAASFKASIQLQTPDKILYEEPIKGELNLKLPKPKKTKNIFKHIKGNVLINKKLTLVSPRHAQKELENLLGSAPYRIINEPMIPKISLNPSSSFGGYCTIEETNPAISKMDNNLLIPKEDRKEIKLNNEHGSIAYFRQDNHNPSGTGFVPTEYCQSIQPKKVPLPQIHYPEHIINDSLFNKMTKKELNPNTHKKLVAGFGVMPKSHPNRAKYLGNVGEEFIDSGKLVPEGFDFAIWNSAYPDQQVDELKGNEWIVLTNLCHLDTLSAIKDNNDNVILRLYLPESIAYLTVNSHYEEAPIAELPMKLDTVLISPDEQKVNLVWRGILNADYKPKTALLQTINQQEQNSILKKYFTQNGEVVRPYLQEIQS